MELIIDSFAGGGGASLGISRAIGRGPDVAINHDAAAIAMHAANHPETVHCTEDVWKVSPHTVVKGRDVGLLWASPDCCHFSLAKGAKPVKKEIRSLAWVVIKWCAEVRPRVVILENVREFEDWGPLVQKFIGKKAQVLEDGSPVLIPDPTRKGHSFRRWVGRLKALGYAVQWRVLNAADYGAPTHRRRLFLVARCDGQPIAWPRPTHCAPDKVGNKWDYDGKDAIPLTTPKQAWRTAAECIDWSIPCPSIFDRKRPLAPNTLKRIAMGIKRYVLDSPRPFIVQVNHGGPDFRGQPVNQPLPTVTGKHGYGLATPVLSRIGQTNGNGSDGTSFGEGRCKRPDEPLDTVHAGGNNHALLAATMVQTGYGERNGQAPRCLDVGAPLGTVVSGQKHAAVTAFLAKHFGGVVGTGLNAPTSTCTAKDHQSLVAANLVHLNNNTQPTSPGDPLYAVTAGGNHAAMVYSFLTKYFGTAIGANLMEPAPTATGKDRFGLVTVRIDGEPYVITDIGMRMLTPRELARAQGFPDSYQLTGSKTSQVARIGNSVAPAMAEVLVRSNYTPAKMRRKANVS